MQWESEDIKRVFFSLLVVVSVGCFYFCYLRWTFVLEGRALLCIAFALVEEKASYRAHGFLSLFLYVVGPFAFIPLCFLLLLSCQFQHLGGRGGG